jgi:hypothetical protein
MSASACAERHGIVSAVWFKRRRRMMAFGDDDAEDQPDALAHVPGAYAGITAGSWAVSTALALLEAVRLEASLPGASGMEIIHLEVSSPDSLSLCFRLAGFDGPVGLHLDLATRLPDDLVARGPDCRAGDCSPGELAFDIVNLIIGEPFGEEGLGPPDAQGVRWRDLGAQTERQGKIEW